MSLRWALLEMILGANPAIHLYGSSFAMGQVLHRLGNADQKTMAAYLAEKNWGATMVLTEPDAASDVGSGRTKAVQQPDGTWHITGVKRFITSAESDMVENVIHMVLARPEGAGPGTKGLSLFVVPKYHVDLATGELGERNGAYVTNVEDKMGIKVSTTCEVRFGEKHPAVGTLLGDVHDGIAQMFHIIEGARMMVGTKAMATLSTGYLNALAYARSGSRAPTHDAGQDAPRVTITHHPDVRRSLMLQKAYAEACARWSATPRPSRTPSRWPRPRTGGRISTVLAGGDGREGQRPAAADRQGLRVRAGVDAAGHRVAADLRWVRIPPGLPDRAVRPGREDRHALRGQ